MPSPFNRGLMIGNGQMNLFSDMEVTFIHLVLKRLGIFSFQAGVSPCYLMLFLSIYKI